PRGSLTNAGRTHRDARPASELERPDQDTKERTIMSGNQAPPQPHPALRRLDCLVGTWTMPGSLVGSDDKNITRQTTLGWLAGGFFLEQRARIDFAGQQIDALELIGYDPQTDTFPSTVFSGFSPTPLPYRWDVRGDSVTITVAYAPLDATFTGSWRQDGTFSGGWRPNPAANETENVPNDIGGTRLQHPITRRRAGIRHGGWRRPYIDEASARPSARAWLRPRLRAPRKTCDKVARLLTGYRAEAIGHEVADALSGVADRLRARSRLAEAWLLVDGLVFYRLAGLIQ